MLTQGQLAEDLIRSKMPNKINMLQKSRPNPLGY